MVIERSKVAIRQSQGILSQDAVKIRYPNFQECFLMFHPFLKIKEGHEQEILFKPNKWPSKKEIQDHCLALSWTEFLKISGMRDYASIDATLAFYHRERLYAEKSENFKLRKITELVRRDIIPPRVDELPEILENPILKFLFKKGYQDAYFYTDVDAKEGLSSLENQFTCDEGLGSHIRIETPDAKVLIAQDFGLRYTYIFGQREFTQEMVEDLDLEGFYCDDTTTDGWSYANISMKHRISWGGDMALKF